MKVAIYLRVSTLDQDYKRQFNEIKSFCKSNKYTIVKTFEEKVSGAKDERPEFIKLCNLTKKDIDAVIVWEISRLSRRLVTLVKTIDDFKDKGINVISLKEHFELLDKDGQVSPSSMIMMSLFATMAEIERENIIQRTKTGTLNKMRDGLMDYTCFAPLGYKLVNKKLVIDEEGAEIARNIFNDYVNGTAMEKLSKIYHRSSSTIGRMLHNPVYIGKPYSNVLEKTLTAPQIIDDELFERAQSIASYRRVTRANVGSVANPLKGLMRCEKCGKVISYRGKVWSCKAQCSNVQSTVLDVMVGKIMNRIREERLKATDIQGIKDRRKAVVKRLKAVEQLYGTAIEDYDNLKKKVDVLKSVFSTKELKKEIASLESLEKKANEIEREMTQLKIEKKKLTADINADYSDISIADVASLIILGRVDKVTRSFKVITNGGNVWSMTYRSRTGEYSITKERPTTGINVY